MTSTDLLSAVLADPFDDAPRLILADWLEENDDPERAEFIRTQIANPELYEYQHRRFLTEKPFDYRIGSVESIGPSISDIGDIMECELLTRRGFPDEIRCTMAQWIGTDECRSCGSFSRSLGIPAIDFCLTCHGTGRTPGIAKAVCEAWPVTRVVLTDRMPTCSTSGGSRWRLDIGLAQLDSGIFLGPYRSKTEAERVVSHAAVNYGRRLAGLP